MTPAVFDATALIASILSIFFVLQFSSSTFGRMSKGLFLTFVVFTIVRNLSNTLQWTEVTSAFSPFEDYLEILIPILWTVAVFSSAQTVRESELTGERINFRSFFDSISDLAFVLNKRFHIIHANPAAEARLGYSQNELTSKHIRDLLRSSKSEDESGSENGGIQITGLTHIDCVMQARNGVPIPVEMKLSHGRWNGVDAFFCISRDVTERRFMETRLRQSEKMDIIGQMAGGIAHDFNNQLLGIMGYADVLVRALKPDPKLSAYAKNLQTSASHAAEITKRLLEFSRAEHLQLKLVNLHLSVEEVVAMLAHSIDKQIVIEHRLEAPHPFIMGDPTQIQSAVLNISLNARDAMPHGGKIVFSTDDVHLDKARCRTLICEATPGPHIRLEISDAGVGMDEAVINRMFEPFFTTKEKGRGTGMGMTAVYNTMKNHKGGIAVKSKVGEGTAISLFFPIAAQTTQTPALDSAMPKMEAEYRVLLVDDEAVVREVTSELLTHMGCSVFVCRNGLEAVDYFRSHHDEIDIVLLDVVMPTMNGKEAFVKIREIDPSARIVVSSGHTSDKTAQALVENGNSVFLVKPYRYTDLLQKIQEVMHKAANR